MNGNIKVNDITIGSGDLLRTYDHLWLNENVSDVLLTCYNVLMFYQIIDNECLYGIDNKERKYTFRGCDWPKS